VRVLLKHWQRVYGILILLSVGIIVFLYWRRHSPPLDAAGMMQCLPQDQSTHVYIDVDALRRAGIVDLLAGPKTAEDSDYRKFVDQTHFDYRTDLSAIAAAFWHGNTYFVVRGRFAWKQLAEYAASQGGHCRSAICEMPGSQPDRNISFYPLKSDLLALAVSKEPRGITMIGPGHWRTPPRISSEPVWISVPAFAFTDTNAMPAGTHAFFRTLAQAQNVIFTAGPEGNRLEVRLDATCNSPAAAADVAKQFTDTTDLLKKMLDRDHMTPNPGDLSGVLSSGVFHQQDQRVTGEWPIDRSFVEALVSGKLE
jgi:hypothetical protein